jgi:hypothetical protein
MPRERRNYKKELEIALAHKHKLVKDLVDFALEWQKLKGDISISTKALANYVTVDTMSSIIIDTFTKKVEDSEEV